MLLRKIFSAPNFAILPTGFGTAVKIAYTGSDYPYSRQLVETENTDTAAHDRHIAALTRALWTFDDAVKVALELMNYGMVPSGTIAQDCPADRNLLGKPRPYNRVCRRRRDRPGRPARTSSPRLSGKHGFCAAPAYVH